MADRLGPTRRSPLELPDTPRIPGPQVKKSDSPMVPDGNGTYFFDHAGFTAKVARDGRVTLEDKPSMQPFVEGPCLSCMKEGLADYVEDPHSGGISLLMLIPKVGVKFDVTDWIMRKIGDDPYNHAKDRFLNDTREQREAMWRDEDQERLRKSLQFLPGQLAEIWSHEEWTVNERKRVLFDLWDECAESGPAERVLVGKQIRATIIAFIRKHIPAGSEHAYTRDELDALNAQRSAKQVFAPYPQDARPDE